MGIHIEKSPVDLATPAAVQTEGQHDVPEDEEDYDEMAGPVEDEESEGSQRSEFDTPPPPAAAVPQKKHGRPRDRARSRSRRKEGRRRRSCTPPRQQARDKVRDNKYEVKAKHPVKATKPKREKESKERPRRPAQPVKQETEGQKDLRSSATRRRRTREEAK
jgi:hypothetical protein